MPASTPAKPSEGRASLPAALQRLYVRIWLAVLLAVAVLTILVGWAWRAATDPPLRDLVVRNDAGQIIGQGVSRRSHNPEDDTQDTAEATPYEAEPLHRGPFSDGPPGPRGSSPESILPPIAPDAPTPPPVYTRGPEFVVRMADGQRLLVHLPRPPRSQWNRPPFGFFWMLGLVGVAMALAMYPIIRRLTRRLESLQRSVDQWGQGDLSVRVPIKGHDEAGLLALRFNDAADRIERLVKAQKSLLANASHELRSPLARIRMGLELMGDGGSTAPKNEIKRNIAELDELIEEILLASRLDAHESDMGTVEEVDMIGLVAEECARTDAGFATGLNPSPDADAPHESDDTPGQPVIVLGVTKLLRRAVRNLLENARRYTTGPVVATLQPTGDRAVLRVFDRGPGVPAELRERIFEPFYRLPGASERDGGVGLGLALVKSIAERHGGSVHCEGREGGGACFVIDLPLQTGS
jgi:signal transduction histidine kinase